ncbi:MAG: hypothetical protein JWP97_1407, partial [Labilithrix sp.]|nr:hypothetical protein [Labilithrix sp.]
MTSHHDRLDRLVREAKQHDAGPELSPAAWQAMEDRILAGVGRPAVPPRRVRAWAASATVAALAAAAAVLLVVHSAGPPAAPLPAPTAGTISPDPEAGLLRETQGPGEVRIRGAVAAARLVTGVDERRQEPVGRRVAA